MTQVEPNAAQVTTEAAKPASAVTPPTAVAKPEATALGAKSEPSTVTPEAKVDPAAKPVETKVEGEPIKYEFKTPENVKLDEGVLGEFTKVASDLKMPPAEAQKFVDMAVKHTENITKQIHEQGAAALKQAGEGWRKEIENDPEIGGAQFKENMEHAMRFRDKFSTPKDLESLKPLFDTAWGNHPALVRLFVKAGKAMGDDKFVDGSPSSPTVDRARVLYPNMK